MVRVRARGVFVVGALLALLLAYVLWSTKGPEPVDFDLVSTALNHLAQGREASPAPPSGGSRVTQIVSKARLQSAIFQSTGDVYKHYEYPEPAQIALEAGTCWSEYLAFIRDRQRDEFGETRVDFAPDDVAEVDRLLAVEPLTRRADGNLELFKRRLAVRHPLPPGDAPKTVRLLATGHAVEAKRAESVRAFEARFPGKARFVTVEQKSDAELFGLLGRRLTAACLVGDLLIKDVTEVDQWIEIVLSRDLIPRPSPKHPDLRIFDAHEHVLDGGLDTFARILDHNAIRCAVVAAVPDDMRYGGAHEANLRVLHYAKSRPGTIVPLVILSPFSADPLTELKDYLSRGARGVKLMTGHGRFYETAPSDLDTSRMREVFKFCEEASIPILWHVNAHLYGKGFLRVLTDFPRLKVVNPHLGGYLSFAPSTVRRLLERHPNLYLDFSFGTNPIYLRRALEDLSFKREAWRRLVIDFEDRFLFGVDMVVTRDTTLSHANMLYRLYRSLLEDEVFDLTYYPSRGYSRLFEESHNRLGLKGLRLHEGALRKIYLENAARLYGIP